MEDTLPISMRPAPNRLGVGHHDHGDRFGFVSGDSPSRAPSSIVAMRLVEALDLDPDHGLGADLIRHSIAGVGYDRWS